MPKRNLDRMGQAVGLDTALQVEGRGFVSDVVSGTFR